jgi:DNA-binding MarR family transcriptional regulator
VTSLPEDVRLFLHQNIDSVEQLEVLLLLWRAPERGWTSEDVARAVYSHPTSVARRLARLLGQGLLREREPGCYQYAPHTAELHQIVTRLDHTYRERRVAVITLIASKPIENVRAFSDAFRIRRKKEDD